MTTLRMAAVALAAVAAAAAASPVGAQPPDGSTAPSVDTPKPSLLSMAPSGALLQQMQTLLGPGSGLMGDMGMDMGMGMNKTYGAVSVQDEFFTVPEPFPDVMDVEDVGDGIESALERAANAVLLPYLTALNDGTYDDLFMAVRRGLFDQMWFAVNVLIELGRYFLIVIFDIVETIGELVDELNELYVDFREGAYDSLQMVDVTQKTIGGLKDLVSSMRAGKMGPHLANTTNRMAVAHARLASKVGAGPLAFVRDLIVGGHEGMKARVRGRAAAASELRF